MYVADIDKWTCRNYNASGLSRQLLRTLYQQYGHLTQCIYLHIIYVIETSQKTPEKMQY